jgi:hypothetical protein
MQFIIIGVLLLLNIPPPLSPTVFPVKVQLIRVGLLKLELPIPPPLLVVEFSLNVQLTTLGLPPEELLIPPEDLAVFPMNVQFVTVGRVL